MAVAKGQEGDRHFARVATRMRAHARRTASLDDPLLFRPMADTATTPSAEMLKESNLPEVILEFLKGIDAKLDMLVSHMGRNSLERDFPLDIEVREISGAGAQFRTDEPMQSGDTLEMVLVLSAFPLRLAGVKGRVLGIDEATGWHRFEFTTIRKADREAVVQYVFQEEREEIRRRKWN